MVKTVIAQRRVPRSSPHTAGKVGESPRALYQPGRLQRAVVECSARLASPDLNCSPRQDRSAP